MNTSTKILLGLVITAFTIPALLAMTLKMKVKNKDYVVIKMEDEGHETPVIKGQIPAYKSVKIVGMETENFTCYINYSDTASFEYRKEQGDDSIRVSVIEEVLVIERIPSQMKQNDNYGDLRIKLHLPKIQNITVDGAAVLLDSLISADSFSATLKNNAIIRQNKPRDESMNIPVAPKGSQTATTTVVTTESITITEDEKVIEMANQNLHNNKEVKDVVIFHLM